MRRLIYNTSMRLIRFVSLAVLSIALLAGLTSSVALSWPGEATRLLGQANLAQSQNQPAEAARALQQLLNLQPWRSELYEKLAELQLDAGDPSAAIAAYQQAYQENALDAGGILRLAQLQVQTGNTTQARILLTDLLKTTQLTDGIFFQAADRLKEFTSAQDFLALLNAILEKNPTDGRALYLKGVYLAPTDSAQAVLALEQAGRKDEGLQVTAAQLLASLDAAAQAQSDALAEMEIGRSLADLGEWQAAEIAFQQAADLQPDMADAWAFLSEAKQNQGKPADSEIERALALAPNSSTVKALAALYYRRMGKPEIALVYLHSAADQEPDVAYWQVELGKTLCALNNFQDALPYFVNATELEPDNAQNWIELARFSLNYGVEPAKFGLPAARKAVLLAPKNAQALDILGALFLTQNDLASAERFLQQSLQQDAANSEAHLHLGQVYLASGNLEAARPYLDEALRLSPESAVGKLAERLIRQYYPLQ